jgi:RHS repeat-associated protein
MNARTAWTRLIAAAIGSAALLGHTAALAAGTSPTRINLPNGPGSVEGLGRNFVPSLASGTAGYDIDIALPPAVRSFGPSLSLDYDSAGGASEVGTGWQIGGVPSLRRRVDDGLPHFDADDAWELTGLGMPCDLLEVAPNLFRPEQETGAFVRVKRAQDGERWEARVKNGYTYSFGGEGFAESEDGKVYRYLLREAKDLHGHAIRYEWDTSEGYALLTRVTWNDFSEKTRIEAVFSYEGRPDTYERFSAGIRQAITRRLRTIDVTYGGSLVRRYTLGYVETPQSRLAAFDVVGTDGKTGMPGLKLEYTAPSFATAGQIVTMKAPPGRTPGDPNVSLVDLNGDGLQDVLVAEAGAYRSYLNHDGVSWKPATSFSAEASPSFSLSSVGAQLADLDGDGAVDLVTKSGTSALRYFPGKDASSFAPSVAITTVPNVTFEDPDVRLADMDGDRRTDVIVTTEAGVAIGYNLSGKDWTLPKTVGKVDARQALRFSDGGKTQLCDVNGDRLEDFCYLRSESLTYWLGRGRGVFEGAREAIGVPKFDASSPWLLRDLNGDGWVDLVRVGVDRVEYALAANAGTFEPSREVTGVPKRGPGTHVDFADMNGSGSTDILWVDPTSSSASAYRYLELFPEGRAGLLKTIDNGLGKVTRINYEPAALQAARARDAGKPWTTRMNVAMPVVSRVEVDSSLGDPVMVSEYLYRDGTWDPKDRTFAGFGGGVLSEQGDEYTPTLFTETTFETGLLLRTLRGQPLTSERRDEHGRIFTRQTSTYTPLSLEKSLDGRQVSYTYASAQRTEIIEGVHLSNARTLLSESVQDNFGNVIEERRWGEIVGDDVLAGNDEAIVRRTFANNETDWLLGYLATEELVEADGTRVTGRRLYYDGKAFQGLPLGQVSRGDVTRQDEWQGPSAEDYVLDTATAYNDDGQPIETRDARGGGRYFEWHPDDPATLLSERVKLESDVQLTEIAETDPRFGNLLAVTDYAGQVTRFQYDELGRLTGIVKPGDSSDAPTIAYSYELGNPLSRVITDSRVSSVPQVVEHSETLIDGLGRKRGTLTQAEDAQWVLAGVMLHDKRGEARRMLRPRFIASKQVKSPPVLEEATGSSSWRDATGRDVRTRSELGIETQTVYLPLATQSWDGAQLDETSAYEHTPVVEQFDGLSRLVRASRTLDGEMLSAEYRYNPAGELLERIDPEGNSTVYEYDGKGRRTLVDDPDLGPRRLVYDETDNLVERHNPDGNVIRYTFDLAGRALTEDWDDDGKPEVEKFWDVSPNAPRDPRYRGKLARVLDPTGSTEHEYDDRGRTIATTLTIDGQRFTSGSRYDNLDRESLHIYPDGSSIELRRNLRGQLAGYGEAVSFSFDGDGLELERRFNTGAVQQTAYDADRRLSEVNALSASGATIEHLKWTYDASGNVTALDDLRPDVAPADDRSETYRYDNLYRLRRAQGTWGKTTWDYSPSGNLTRRVSDVQGQTVKKLGYGDGAGPHAPTSLDDRRLTYDALGRLKEDGDRVYTWNAVDQLLSVQNARGDVAENGFDGEGVRRVRKETTTDGKSSTTYFISDWEEVRDGKLVRYVVHADRRIVRLAESTGAVPAAASAVPTPGKATSPPRWLGSLADSGHLAILFALLAALVTRAREMLALRLGRVGRALMPMVVALGIVACSGDAPQNRPDASHGSVTTLSDADTILVHDQLGSVLAEASGRGTPGGRFASYAFGLERYATSNETRLFAGHTRDRGVGLDLMGARFYAPDLGVWTAADPGLLNSPDRGRGADFGAVNAYAYSNLNPIGAKDPDGEFWHIVAGAAVGALIGGGVEAARQYMATGKVEDWGRVGAAAAGSAVAGALTAANPVAGYAAVMSMGAATGVVGGVTTRLVESGGKSVGSLTDIVADAVVGAGSAGLLKGGGAVVSNIAKKAAPKVANAVGKIRSISSEKIFQKQYKQLGQTARKARPCNCFGKGTLVWSATGLRQIQDLRVGDQVWSWNEQTGEIALKPITETFVTPDRPLVELAVSGSVSEVITTTPGHPFWVEGAGWVHAEELVAPDALRFADTTADPASAARLVDGPPARGTVYNLTVAEFHTYFVGNSGVLVHNTSPCGVSPPLGPADLAGKTRDELRQLASDRGLVPHATKADKFLDPVTGKERLRLDPGHIDKQTGLPYNDPKAAVPHAHGYEPNGKTKIVDPSDGNPHFPTR